MERPNSWVIWIKFDIVFCLVKTYLESALPRPVMFVHDCVCWHCEDWLKWNVRPSIMACLWVLIGWCKLNHWGLDRADSSFAPSQWETVLLRNDVSHWLGANLESALPGACFSENKPIEIRVSQQRFSNNLFDWLTAVLLASQKPRLKIRVNSYGLL